MDISLLPSQCQRRVQKSLLLHQHIKEHAEQEAEQGEMHLSHPEERAAVTGILRACVTLEAPGGQGSCAAAADIVPP